MCVIFGTRLEELCGVLVNREQYATGIDEFLAREESRLT